MNGVKVVGQGRVKLGGLADKFTHDREDANQDELVGGCFGGFETAVTGGMGDLCDSDLGSWGGQGYNVVDQELVDSLKCGGGDRGRSARAENHTQEGSQKGGKREAGQGSAGAELGSERCKCSEQADGIV